MIRDPEYIVLRKTDWRWLVIVSVSLYFVLCFATFYLVHEVRSQAIELDAWRVAYCRQYTQLFAAQHPEAQGYLQEDMDACGKTS